MRLFRAAAFCICVAAGSILGGEYGISPDGRNLELPGGVLGPTKDADCDKLQATWDDISTNLQIRHQQCLDSHQGQKPNPNAGGGNGDICSFPACQNLHTARTIVSQKQKPQIEACRAALKEYQAREKQIEDQQRQEQADLQRRQDEMKRLQAEADARRQQALAQQQAIQEKKRAEIEAAKQKIQQQLAQKAQAAKDAEAAKQKQMQDAQKASDSALGALQQQSADVKKEANALADSLTSSLPQSQTSSTKDADQQLVDQLNQDIAQRSGNIDRRNAGIDAINAPAQVVADGTVVSGLAAAEPSRAQGYVGAAGEVVKGTVDGAFAVAGLSKNPELQAVKLGYDGAQGLVKAAIDPAPGSTTTGLTATAAAGLEAVEDDLAKPVGAAGDAVEALSKYTEGKKVAAAGSAVKAAGGIAGDLGVPGANAVTAAGGITSAGAQFAEGVSHVGEVTETAQKNDERLDQLQQQNDSAVAKLSAANSRDQSQINQDLAQLAQIQARRAAAASPAPDPTAFSAPPPAQPSPLVVPQAQAQAPAPDRSAETDAVLKQYSDVLNTGISSSITFGKQSNPPPSKPLVNVQYENYDHPEIPSLIEFGKPQQDIPLLKSDGGIRYDDPNQPNIPTSITFPGGSSDAYQKPVPPRNPDASQCATLENQWSTLQAQIAADHDQCLKKFSNGGRSDSAGLTCNVRACQALHNSMVRGPQMAQAAVTACRNAAGN